MQKASVFRREVGGVRRCRHPGLLWQQPTTSSAMLVSGHPHAVVHDATPPTTFLPSYVRPDSTVLQRLAHCRVSASATAQHRQHATSTPQSSDITEHTVTTAPTATPSCAPTASSAQCRAAKRQVAPFYTTYQAGRLLDPAANSPRTRRPLSTQRDAPAHMAASRRPCTCVQPGPTSTAALLVGG